MAEDSAPSYRESSVRQDDGAAYFVWGTWLFLLVSNLYYTFLYGRRLPFCDDWDVVEVLTGIRPFHISWLWDQHNEHRIFLPKLIWWGLYPATGYDFRASVILNVTLMAVVSLLLVLSVRRLRGHTHFVDAFIPLTYLRWGNGGFLWSFNLQFTLSVFFSSVLLALLIRPKTITSPVTASIAGLCVLMLPLIGASGLLIAAIMLAWLGLMGVLQWKGVWPGGRRPAVLLLSFMTATLFLIALYGIGLQVARNPNLEGTHNVKNTLVAFIVLLNCNYSKFCTFEWPLSACVILSFYALAGFGLIYSLWRDRAGRPRDFGMLCFIGAQSAVMLAIGWARGQHVWQAMSHYAMPMIPGLAWLFLALEIYAAPMLRRPIQMILLLLGCTTLWDDRGQLDAWRDQRQIEHEIERELNESDNVSTVVNYRMSVFASDSCGVDDPKRKEQITQCLQKLKGNK